MRLYVNIDHVATVRQARRTVEPDPVHAALNAELAGADGITVHLREDRRHIQERDVRLLQETLRSGLNLELAANEAVVSIACEVRPMQVTLVPENREEVTTEGGLDLASEAVLRNLRGSIDRLREAGIRISLFIDPTEDSIQRARELGVEAIELHTGEYANARTGEERGRELERLHAAARRAGHEGLGVHAGHGLTYTNVTPVAALPGIEELNIGHSIVSRSILVGIAEAVGEMRRLLREAPSRVERPGTWLPPIGH